MKRYIILILALLSSASCEKSLLLSRARYSIEGHDIQVTDKDSDAILNPDNTLVVVGVEFPDNYDWHRDSAAGICPSRLVIFEDGVKVDEIPAGEQEQISTDPGTHHLIDGCLFTEYTNGTQTIIKSNGIEIFRYKGCEHLKGIMVEDGDVWTLGQNLLGEGFSLRRNGESVMIREKGTVMGDEMFQPGGILYKDMDEICFAFYIDNATSRTYYMVEDGNPRNIDFGVRNICDLRREQGVVYVLGTDVTTNLPVVKSEDRTRNIISSSLNRLVDGVFISASSPLLIAGTSIRLNGSQEENFKMSDNSLQTMEAWQIMYSFKQNNNIASVSVNGKDVLISDSYDIPNDIGKNCFFFSRHCAIFGKNDYLVALSPRTKGEKPFVVGKSTVSEYDFNGYISAIELIADPPS